MKTLFLCVLFSSAGLLAQQDEPAAGEHDLPVARNLREAIAGRYWLSNQKVRLVNEAGSLWFCPDGGKKARLLYQGDHLFLHSHEPINEFRFEMQGAECLFFEVYQSGMVLDGERVVSSQERLASGGEEREVVPISERSLPMNQGRQLYETEFGWVIAGLDDEPRARWAAREVSDALAVFRHVFGVQAGPGLVTCSAKVGPELDEAIRKAGAEWVLPASWYANSTVPQASAGRFSDLEVDGDDLLVEVCDQMDRPLGVMSFTSRKIAAGSFPNTLTRHELGHALFSAYVLDGETHGYQHVCPDWLEEAAAIVCEKGKGESYWEQVREDFLAGELPDLATFLEARHPSRAGGAFQKQMESQLHPEEGAETQTISMDPEASRESQRFYGQARLLLDFLWWRSQDLAVLRKLAVSLSQGETMTEWLAREGESHGLPVTVEGLETAWHSWVASRYRARAK